MRLNMEIWVLYTMCSNQIKAISISPCMFHFFVWKASNACLIMIIILCNILLWTILSLLCFKTLLSSDTIPLYNYEIIFGPACMSGNIWSLFFRVWLISFPWCLSRSIHATTNGRISSFVTLGIIFLCECTQPLLYSFTRAFIAELTAPQRVWCQGLCYCG